MENSNGVSRRERERLFRRTAMLDAAKAVFAERGYAQATLDEIAGRAEFGKGTIYNYFPDGKEEILLAIFDQLYDGLCELIETSFRDSDARPFRESIETLVANSFHFFYQRYNLFMILVKEAERLVFSDSESKVAYFAAQQERVIATLAAPLKEAMDRGELRTMPPELLAHMLFVNIKGCQIRHCPRQRPGVEPVVDQSPAELVTFLTDLILIGAASKQPVPAT